MRTRSVIPIGYPLEGFGWELKYWNEQAELYLKEPFAQWRDKLEKAFNIEHTFFRRGYRERIFWDDLEIRWWNGPLNDLEQRALSDSDRNYLVFALIFCFFFMWIYTKSSFIAGFALFQEFMTLPISAFIYIVVLQIPYFTQINIIALFILLGVG